MAEDSKQAIKEFKSVVNMSVAQIEKWLDSDESKKVGLKKTDASESVGHESGRHIIKMLNKKQDDFSADDIKHARKVVGYVHRHLAQRPDGNVTETNWRYSLMNWGHDPEHNS